MRIASLELFMTARPFRNGAYPRIQQFLIYHTILSENNKGQW